MNLRRLVVLSTALLCCLAVRGDGPAAAAVAVGTGRGSAVGSDPTDRTETFCRLLSDAALELTRQNVVYDPSYFRIAYPGGDVPAGRGVCTDVVIRAYRLVGIDIQQLVHLDMKANFALYPRKWGLRGTDTNIDHRRVPNLMTFFARKGVVLPVSSDPADYRPGHIVCWSLGGGITHIGIVVARLSRDGRRPLVVHNIGAGQVAEDCLLSYRVIGHYLYTGPL